MQAVRRVVLFVEIFLGKGVLTSRVEANGIPTLRIPDILDGGPDLLTTQGVEAAADLILRTAGDNTVILAAAPPCSTFSNIRDRLKAIRVRSPKHPEGLPGFKPQTASKVADGNALVEVADNLALQITERGGHASVKSPGSSYL